MYLLVKIKPGGMVDASLALGMLRFLVLGPHSCTEVPTSAVIEHEHSVDYKAYDKRNDNNFLIGSCIYKPSTKAHASKELLTAVDFVM